MDFFGEYKITTLDNKHRFVIIKGEVTTDRGLAFVLDDGSDILIGDIKYLCDDLNLWRVTNDHEVVGVEEEEYALILQDAIRESPLTSGVWQNSNAADQLEAARDATEEILDERNRKVAELEKEIVELKKTPKKAAKKAEEDNESKRLPSEPKEE